MKSASEMRMELSPEQKFGPLKALEDAEVQTAIQQVVQDPKAIKGLSKLFFGYWAHFPPLRWLLAWFFRWVMRNVSSVEDLHGVMKGSLDLVLNQRKLILEVHGEEHFSTLDTPLLFISNHRDIVLDSLLLNRFLFSGYKVSSRVAIGDNLLQLPDWGSILMRAVGCFMVDRTSGSSRHQYRNHQMLSSYIRYLLTDKLKSVWLAQSAGRSVDGVDRTDPAVLKMLRLADRKQSFSQAVGSYRIVPVTLSYEYDSCGFYKAQRLAAVARDQRWNPEYAKEAQSSFLADKGRVCLQLGRPIEAAHEPQYFESPEALSQELDVRIRSGYQFWPTAYVAAGLLIEAYENARALQQQVPEQPAYFSHDVIEAAGAQCPWNAQELQKAQQYFAQLKKRLDALEQYFVYSYYANALLQTIAVGRA
ncbi:MAG: 1-acyl-sn-glycerol-3-phosphate acyltransferase [Gammaproteobacteria bacterium]